MKNIKSIFASFWLAFLFPLLIGSSAFAQDQNGIQGTVKDEQGGAITAAQVLLRSRLGTRLSTTTDQTGSFTFHDVPSGDYLIEVRASGFSLNTSEIIRLTDTETRTVSIQLPVAAISASVVVTPTGTAQRLDEVAKAVTALDSEEIEANHDTNLAEALRGTPGLRVQQQGSPGALTSLRLRGQRNFDTAILLDGLRVRDSADINGSAVPFITDLTNNDVDRVEILRGSGSSIYGTNAIGGVINVVPKVGSGAPRFSAAFEAGSLALFRETLEATGGLGRGGGFSLGITRLDVRRGVDGSDEYGNTAASGRLQLALTPSVDIVGTFFGTSSNARQNSSPLPLIFPSPTDPIPTADEGTNFHPDFNNPDQGRRNNLWLGSAKLRHQVSEAFSYSVAYQKVWTRRRNYNGPLVDPRFASLTPFGDFEFVSVNNGGTDTVDFRGNIRLAESNLATVGFEFENETLFQRFTSAFGAPAGTTDRQRTFGIFGQDQIFLFDDRLQISIGARQQFFRIRSADRPGFLNNIQAENSITGDGSIAYFIRSTGTKLRVHVGNGFRAPSLFERFGDGVFQNVPTRFGDPTLRAEQSIAFDGGFDQHLPGNRLLFGLTYFYTRLQRVIDFKGFRSFFDPTADPDPLGLDRTGGFLNFPGGISRGLEAYLEAVPFRGSTLRSAYTYTNSDRFASPGGLQTQFVIPRHQFGLSFIQRYRRLIASFNLNQTGDYIAPIFPVTFKFNGFVKVDLYGTYEHPLSDRVSLLLFGGVDNILNDRYFENGFRAPGAMGKGGIKLRF
ncbi:MAG TPA: TonB-dependent receptor [Pyrinomonadaceae bacterium]